MNKKKKNNVLCIIGLVCSFISSILGLIFCGLGLKQVKQSGEKGEVLANAGILICFFRTIILVVLPSIFVYPSITSSLVLSTACSNLDDNGNYVIKDSEIGESEDGYVRCTNFYCEAYYNGKTHKRDCNE